MPKGKTEKTLTVRYCGRCGERLTQSNKNNPPRCYNTTACESRARKKFEETTKTPYTPPVSRIPAKVVRKAPVRPKFYNLSFEHVLDAVCQRFAYDNRQRAELLGNGGVKEYQHSRYLLFYLLIDDLEFSQEKAAEYLERDRKTAGTAYVHVRENPTMYELDIRTIRLLYPVESKQLA